MKNTAEMWRLTAKTVKGKTLPFSALEIVRCWLKCWKSDISLQTEKVTKIVTGIGFLAIF